MSKIYNFESLDDAIISIVERALEGIDSAGDFVLETAPMIIQQYLHWKLLEHSIYILTPILLFGLMVIIYRFFSKRFDTVMKESDRELHGSEFNILGRYVNFETGNFASIWSILMAINLLAILITLFVNIIPIIQIIIAPYVYLIEVVLNKL